jgi:Uncharacterized protein conserved in bacteria
MYLGSTFYRIHGSNEEETIGEANSSGCFRMTNADVIDLYSRVKSAPRSSFGYKAKPVQGIAPLSRWPGQTRP